MKRQSKKTNKLFNNFINENKYLLLATLILFILAIGIIAIQNSFALDEIYSGTSGDCNLVINNEGKLIISPESDSCTLGVTQLEDDIYKMPWYDNNDDITSVYVEQGVSANPDSSYLFSDLKNVKLLDLRNLDMNSVSNVSSMFENVGTSVPEGTSFILNPSFNEDYSKITSYKFPYDYYAYDGSDLYDLSSMKEKVLEGNSYTWYPAYKVIFDSVEGKIGEDKLETISKVYPINSYIDTNNLKVTRKNDVLNGWCDTLNEEDSTFKILKDEQGEIPYGENYSAVGVNNVITIYAQYDINALKKDVVFLKVDEDTSDPIEGAVFKLTGESYNHTHQEFTATSDASGKVIFKDVLVGEYELKEITPATNYTPNDKIYTVKVGEPID